ncbi:MAG: dihydroorotase [Akkermansia sp.]|nr:dihydroorotase [Akkermansia sp.]MBR7109881.1 dihydroorotase [Akkermansia sp.]
MEITLESPLDMHLHLRDGDMLKLVAPLSADFAGAVIMPNLVPPVTDPGAMVAYGQRIDSAMGGADFSRYMTLFFTKQTEQQLTIAKETPGFFGYKLYPAGITTNSEGGVANLAEAESTLKMMEEMGIPLLIHGESHGFVMDRESEFLAVYKHLAQQFPKLRICMEHITTAAALDLLEEFENLCATVTLQHLIITLDDVAGGALQPHLFCKPIAKRPQDRDALLQAAISGHPRLMFGSDSAPHPRCKKEACGCAAGVFTAPLALPKLAEIFARHGALDKLQGFVSGNACRIHGLTPTAKKVTLQDTPMAVPASYRSYGQQVVPMYAGAQINWSIKA